MRVRFSNIWAWLTDHHARTSIALWGNGAGDDAFPFNADGRRCPDGYSGGMVS